MYPPMSVIFRISIFMVAVDARLKASVLSSILGQSIPGVSNNKNPEFVLSQFICFVTPGLFPVFATFLPANLFIRVLLPTLGIPITPILISLLLRPLSILFSCIGFTISFVNFINFL